jgi:hypothetical protein
MVAALLPEATARSHPSNRTFRISSFARTTTKRTCRTCGQIHRSEGHPYIRRDGRLGAPRIVCPQEAS